MSELLPAPFGPRRPNIRLPIVSERFLSAFTPFGYVLDRPVMVSAKEDPPISSSALPKAAGVFDDTSLGCSGEITPGCASASNPGRGRARRGRFARPARLRG